MTTLRAILHYAVLVGLPILGVIMAMQIGMNLVPPPTIKGRWKLNADLEANSKNACAISLAGFSEKVLTITQSGVFLEVHLPNAQRDVLGGRLNGDSFLAEAHPALFGDDVFGLLRASGSLEGVGDKRIIRGLIAMPRRVDCIPVPFIATLESKETLRKF
ncbi:MAG: hypothetical protein NW208_19020 [Bryobacter sp.]|nr:hypothetical protein [Bryobacter sp.]